MLIKPNYIIENVNKTHSTQHSWIQESNNNITQYNIGNIKTAVNTLAVLICIHPIGGILYAVVNCSI